MKYFGKDAPRITDAGDPRGPVGALIWNTNRQYSKPNGERVDQTVEIAWPQAQSSYNALLAAGYDVQMDYTPGGYCRLRITTQATSIDPATGMPVQDPSQPISEFSWSIQGSDGEASAWNTPQTWTSILGPMVDSQDAKYNANDRRRIWRAAVQAWTEGESTYSFTDLSSSTEYQLTLSYQGLLDLWYGYTNDTGNTVPVASFLQALMEGWVAIPVTQYVFTRNLRIPEGYTQFSGIYDGVHQIWLKAQLQALTPAALVLPDIPYWLKRPPTMRIMSNDSAETEETWESGDFFPSFFFSAYAG